VIALWLTPPRVPGLTTKADGTSKSAPATGAKSAAQPAAR